MSSRFLIDKLSQMLIIGCKRIVCIMRCSHCQHSQTKIKIQKIVTHLILKVQYNFQSSYYRCIDNTFSQHLLWQASVSQWLVALFTKRKHKPHHIQKFVYVLIMMDIVHLHWLTNWVWFSYMAMYLISWNYGLQKIKL